MLNVSLIINTRSRTKQVSLSHFSSPCSSRPPQPNLRAQTHPSSCHNRRRRSTIRMQKAALPLSECQISNWKSKYGEGGRKDGRNGRDGWNAKPSRKENSFKPILIFRPMIFSGRRRSGRSLRPSAAPWPSFRYAPDLNGSLDRRRSPRISLAIIIRGNFEWWNPPRPPPLTLFDIALATQTFEREGEDH